MTIRTVLNPYGGLPPIVDARIGTAYAVVDICVMNLETITYVANNLPAIVGTFEALPSIILLSNNLAAINAVAQNEQNISIVAADISSVVNVSNNLYMVQAVAQNLPAIQSVYTNMAAVQAVAAQLALEMSAHETGIAPAVGATVQIDYPAAVHNGNLLSSMVHVLATTGDIYFPSSTTFVVTIQDNAHLALTMQAGSAALVGGTIHWHLRYDPTA